MTGCRIGKITDKKTGNSVYRFPDRDLTVHDSGGDFPILKRVNDLVRQGHAKMVAVTVLKHDDTVMSGFSKKNNVPGLNVLGAIEDLRQCAMDWWNK